MTGSGRRGKQGQTRHAGSTSVARSNRDASHNGSEPRADEFRQKIPAGEYDAICYKTEKGKSWGGRRDCYLRFRIHGGKYDGVELFMACTFPEKRISPRYKLYSQWMLAMGRAPFRKERISPNVFRNRMFRVLVRDTGCTYSGTNRLMPDHCQYSVVDTILEPITGVPNGNH